MKTYLTGMLFICLGVAEPQGLIVTQSGTSSPVGLPPAQSLPPQEQKAEPPATLEGKVFNAVTGEPIKKANLILLPEQPQGPSFPFSTASDASGQFSMNNIAPGRYRLMAERTGYVRGNYGARGPMDLGITLTLMPNQSLKQIAFKLQPHSVITGRVTDEDGEPVANVQVQVLTYRYMQGRRQLVPAGGASTNDLGEYRAFGLPAGRYLVSATHRNQTMFGATDRTAGSTGNQPEEGYAATYYPGTNEVQAAVTVQVPSGKALGNMDIRLLRTRTVRVRGRVLNAGAGGSMRTMILLLPRQSEGTGFMERGMPSMVGPDGKFEIRGVTPGSYSLVAQNMDESGRRQARASVDVGNANVEGVELTLKPGMEISGVVKAEGDAQLDLSQLNISLRTSGMNPFGGGGAARVKPDGTFTFRNITPDTYVVSAFGAGQSAFVKAVQAGSQAAAKNEITVIDGAPPELTVIMSGAGGQISGQALSEKKDPLSGATVVLVPPTEKRDQFHLFNVAMSDQNGKFTFKAIPPGEYKLFAWDGVEQGAWQDPEFLARFDSRARSFSLENETF